MNENINTCKECGRQLFGRSDKKFCTDACRSAFNNKQSVHSSLISSINRKLRKNHDILVSQNTEGKTKTHKEKLLKAGFDFELVTSTFTTKDEKEYRFCYDQGYLHLGNDFYLLVKRNSES